MEGPLKLQLPPNSEIITFTNFDLIDNNVVRIEMKINGIDFKRLNERGMGRKPVWLNPSGVIDGCEMLQNEKQEELESIFRSYCIENKFSAADTVKELPPQSK